ncbi:MAG: amidase [Rhizobiales bacterium 62-47]|nr:amidase [Hyphomicrobiales bacterium]OJY12765.1 MAG: amidase [Rhizobiales bacterium 62-47]
MSDFAALDLVGIAEGIARRKFSSREVTQWSLQRAATIGRRYNAFFRVDEELALARAQKLDDRQARGDSLGALHGVPLAHKDIFPVAGREMHAGTVILKGNIAQRTAFAVARLDDAGQVNIGSLHMSEFALSPTGFNHHYGSGLNPWNPLHVCGGSSSGSGAAVAARAVFGSLGGDTAGSIRMPAAMCGITGLKTTYRRMSLQDCVPLSFSLDSLGPIAQSARDCARMLTHCAIYNPADALSSNSPVPNYEALLDGKLQGLRIGVPDKYFADDLDDEVAACLQASLDVLRRCGARIVAVDVPDMDTINSLAQLTMAVEAATLHRKWIEAMPEQYSEQVRNRIDQGYTYAAVRYAEALSLRSRILQEFLTTSMLDCDVLHVPTLAMQTPTIDATTRGNPDDVLKLIGRVTRTTRGFNYLGVPAASVPAGISKAGLPMSFQLVGRPFAEGMLLRIADAFQRETDWHRKQPPLDAHASPQIGVTAETE